MTANIPNSLQQAAPADDANSITALMPDFPFNYGKFLKDAGKSPLFKKKTGSPVDPASKKIAIIGGGISGIVAGYELLRAGFRPVIFEASDRIGGRMYSKHLENGGIAELGAMRFPPSCKALFHYFEKVKMTENMGAFPNPGTKGAHGTLVNYRGSSDYYEILDKKTVEENTKLEKYRALGAKWNDFLSSPPFNLSKMQDALKKNPDDQESRAEIKKLWNSLVESHDDVSFHQALKVAKSVKWEFADIELFGQVGFGSGGWNTNYVNSFLEILRVAYSNLETNHQLFYDGADKLPKDLFSTSPNTFQDHTVPSAAESLLDIAITYFKKFNGTTFNNKVLGIARKFGGDQLSIHFTCSDVPKDDDFDAVIYTPHVRVLQMLRDESEFTQHTRALLSEDMWEAIEYTHYMQSSKTFVSVDKAFWSKKEDGKSSYPMSTTLSDRVTRGTYLLNYKRPNANAADPDKAVICLTYTWNDDALKMLPLQAQERAEIALKALREIYPNSNIDSHVKKNGNKIDVKTIESIMWDQEPLFMGAFKNNLPGHYRYQRRLFSNFAEKAPRDAKNFFLAGDDISWTGGWSEGAVTTGLNAAHAVAHAFDHESHNGKGPLDVWNDPDYKPIDLG